MKHCPGSLIVALFTIMVSCQKTNKELFSSLSDISVHSSSSANASGSGSGGSNNNNTGGFIQSVLSGTASRLISGNSDSILVSFTQAAPAGGWTLTVSSSDPSVQVPATYGVPAGTFGIYVPVTSSPVTNAKDVTITVKLGTQSKTTTLKVFPVTASFPAPSLQSPGDGAGFKSRIQITFDWNDNINAYYNEIEISDNTAFTTPILHVLLNESIWAASYFNGTGMRYWRVRFVDASGNGGPWSAVRRFEIKPQ